MNEAVKIIDFLNLASMLVIPAAGLGYLCLRGRRDTSLRENTPSTFFEKPYVPIATQLLTGKMEPKGTRQTNKVVPITAAKKHSR